MMRNDYRCLVYCAVCRRQLALAGDRALLRDTLANASREHFVDQRLIADAATARFLTERIEDARINADRDQSAGRVTDRRPSHTPHRLQLGPPNWHRTKGGAAAPDAASGTGSRRLQNASKT